ncbi:hypothetical protein T01_11623 [Trichinella spiralis]|uniref:Uncharacterized protein n=1 Tax=Trichinella spiralis TaxID=6334 RepID=A0A0V1BHU0_TRISP|nr:hypothetical protein T01_11623 [Trichinella spiralis]
MPKDFFIFECSISLSFHKCCMIVDNAVSSNKDSLYIHQLVHIPNFVKLFLKINVLLFSDKACNASSDIASSV